MKISVKEAMLTVAVFAFSALGVQLMLPAQPTVAQEQGPAVEQQEEPAAEPAQESAQSESPYQYVTQPGDSYTLMARKAIQTYGIVNNVELSQAQILMAETHLTQEAGEPYLAVGQEVTIGEAAVEKWVEAAQELSEEKEAAWQHYVPLADFNTDDVGEPSN